VLLRRRRATQGSRPEICDTHSLACAIHTRVVLVTHTRRHTSAACDFPHHFYGLRFSATLLRPVIFRHTSTACDFSPHFYAATLLRPTIFRYTSATYDLRFSATFLRPTIFFHISSMIFRHTSAVYGFLSHFYGLRWFAYAFFLWSELRFLSASHTLFCSLSLSLLVVGFAIDLITYDTRRRSLSLAHAVSFSLLLLLLVLAVHFFGFLWLV